MDTHSLARKQHRAFTLIELLVVTAIITILLGVVLTSQSSFNQSVILNSTAYDVGLSIRLAEAYGDSGSGISQLPGPVNYGYGVSFSSPPQNSYTLFADSDGGATNSSCYASSGSVLPANAPNAKIGDCLYTSADTAVHSYTINNGVTINKMCIYDGGSTHCTLTQLDIVFARPGIKIRIRGEGSGNAVYPGGSIHGVGNSGKTAEKACVQFVAAGGASTRSLIVQKSGSITVNNGTCP